MGAILAKDDRRKSMGWLLVYPGNIMVPTVGSLHCILCQPFIPVSGNLVDAKIPCDGTTITQGTKSNSHFQSLLPTGILINKFMKLMSMVQTHISIPIPIYLKP